MRSDNSRKCFLLLFLTHDEVLPLSISFSVCFSFCQSLLVSFTINHHSSLPLSYYKWSSVSPSPSPSASSSHFLLDSRLSFQSHSSSLSLFHLVSSESMMILVPSLPDYDIYHRQRAKPHWVSLPLSQPILRTT